MAAAIANGDAWQEYRKRLRLVTWLFIGYIPGVFILSYPAMLVLGTQAPFYAVGGLWIAALVIAWLRLGFFPCPRCAKSFSSTWWYSNPLATSCVHCGFPKWAKP